MSMWSFVALSSVYPNSQPGSEATAFHADALSVLEHAILKLEMSKHDSGVESCAVIPTV